MTQQNAALVEQATAASRALADQSSALSDEVSRYQFRQDGQPAGGSTRPAARIKESTPAPMPAPKPQRKAPAHAPAPLQGKNAVGDDSSWKEF
jgi:methyl-accepting chemotaxis protein